MRFGGPWLAALFAFTGQAALAADVDIIPTPDPVQQVVETDAGVFIRTASASWRVTACDQAKVCLTETSIEGEPAPAPAGGLPDGRVAVIKSGDIRRAWYGRPTTRYDHGVLGDKIEGSSLTAIDSKGRNFEFVLDRSHVFEDLTPRIFDLDGDGQNEIVAIRSSLDRGAAVAVYGIANGVLAELAVTREIGRSHRWLNIAGIAGYDGAHVAVIAWVETPHIGGTLRFATFDGGELVILSESYRGFSNHFIGSRELGLSATGDFDGDGVSDLAIPSADRGSLVIVFRKGLETIALPGRIAHAIAIVGGVIVTADTEGSLFAIRP